MQPWELNMTVKQFIICVFLTLDVWLLAYPNPFDLILDEHAFVIEFRSTDVLWKSIYCLADFLCVC